MTIAHKVSLRFNSNNTSAWRLFKFGSKAQTKAVRPVTALTVGGYKPHETVGGDALYEMENTIAILVVRR